MSYSYDVAVLVGSLRQDSLNRKTARALMTLAPSALALEFVEIGTLPLYNQDLDTAQPPAEWQTFRDRVRAADALLFATPEYNRSVPGALKNAIDVGSRPGGRSAWSGKPAAIVSVTAGPLGAMAGNHALRQSLLPLNVSVMPAPEAYIAMAGDLFDAEGKLANDSTREFLTKFMQAFAEWVAKIVPK